MPVSQKTFRVFVCSTFTDMRAERRILQARIFPRLEALCKSRGTSFQAVDLRWGVEEKQQLDQKTMEICLGEIARCQRLSPKPNFIVLLGDKYGWQPVPNKIPGIEMELILETIEDKERQFIKRWYQEDRNAIPAEYVLQPIGDEYRSFDDWKVVEDNLRLILRKAVDRLNFTEEQRVKYFSSATHQEIMRGALNPPPDVIAPEEHVFAYMRNIRNLPENIETKDYIDLSGDARDTYSKKQLKKLRVDLEEKLPEEHIYEYGAEWENGCVIDDIEAFGERVYMDLQSIIERQLEEIVIIDALAKEIQIHEEFRKGRIEHFTGQGEALKAISDYLGGNIRKVFSIIGASGTGKTSLMAKAIENARDIEGIKIFRFIGTTSSASDTYKLLFQLISQIVRGYGVEMNSLLREGEDEKKFYTVAGLKDIFTRCLKLASSEKPLFIFLDALDQIGEEYASMPKYWLPEEIPENVKIIVSALPELKERLSHTVIYEIKPMSRDDGMELLDRWLASISRTLQPGQKEEVINKFAVSGNPLYLRLAFEKAKEWHSYTLDTFLKEDIDGILEEYFEDLEGKHGSLLVQKFCGYTLSGKYQGLTETEFLGLFVFDKEYWNYFIERCHPAHREEVKEIGRLPVVVWSRLFLDMEPYLTEKDAEGVSIISFYHRKFNGNARRRYLKDAKKYHTILADYFEHEPLYLDEKDKIPDVRKVVEQPYQQSMADKWDTLVDKSLAYFPFLMAKAKAEMVNALFEDYNFVFGNAPQEIKDELEIWEAFYRERIHILRRGSEDWPAYKILFQLAIEHADDSPLAKAAEEYLAKGNVDWKWLRRIPRLKHARINPCWIVLEGHTGVMEGAIELQDGRILSWAKDFTLRIWESESGQCLSVLEGHRGKIGGAIEMRDGKILSWSADKTLRIWESKSGHCLSVLEGHTGRVDGAIEMRDGKILSWANNDKTLRIWGSESGQSLSVIKGHAGRVGGAIDLQCGKILFWAADKTVRIWENENGQSLSVLEGHSWLVRGAIELRNSKILSWSADSTLRIWGSESGQSLSVLEGHTGAVKGTIELQDGRILSWANNDKTLRIWESESGQCISVLKVHTGLVKGAIELRDGKILFWAFDKTLWIWESESGQSLLVLEGHAGFVDGAVELRDGKILSWDTDKTFRVWESRSGQCLENIRNEDHLKKYQELYMEFKGKALAISNYYGMDYDRTVGLEFIKKDEGSVWRILWQADSRVKAKRLFPDGTLVVNQENGQVCFLKLYYGNRRISLDELDVILENAK